jgi:hypothetical protein
MDFVKLKKANFVATLGIPVAATTIHCFEGDGWHGVKKRAEMAKILNIFRELSYEKASLYLVQLLVL